MPAGLKHAHDIALTYEVLKYNAVLEQRRIASVARGPTTTPHTDALLDFVVDRTRGWKVSLARTGARR